MQAHGWLEERWLEQKLGGPILQRSTVQSLWGGYGEIARVEVQGGPPAILKRIQPPVAGDHPRGWNTDRSHLRKIRSYNVEQTFYERWSSHCGQARVPRSYALLKRPEGWWFLLEDLDAAGFAKRETQPSSDSMRACLGWLARFHAAFLGQSPEGLWPVGTYWHLATRPDELEAMNDAELCANAAHFDRALNGCRYQTFVHGDAKVANFCFGAEGVAAVDFQYVGGGCGIKDVAYFFSSCLDESACAAKAPALLNHYFGELRAALPPEIDADAVESEWRTLYPVAWADFHRFLDGWAPGHWKIHEYTRRMTRQALAGL